MRFSKKEVKKLGKYLKEKRLNSHLSQIHVANHLGYTSGQYVSNWERGLSAPPQDEIWSICKLYKIPKREIIDTLVTGFKNSLEESSRKSR